MEGIIPTYVNCCICGAMARGAKVVPREDRHQRTADSAGGVVVGSWIETRQFPNHKRPVCNGCTANAADKEAA